MVSWHMGGLRKCGIMVYGWADKVWYHGIRVGQGNVVPWYMGEPRKCGTVAYGWANEVRYHGIWAICGNVKSEYLSRKKIYRHWRIDYNSRIANIH